MESSKFILLIIIAIMIGCTIFYFRSNDHHASTIKSSISKLLPLLPNSESTYTMVIPQQLQKYLPKIESKIVTNTNILTEEQHILPSVEQSLTPSQAEQLNNIKYTNPPINDFVLMSLLTTPQLDPQKNKNNFQMNNPTIDSPILEHNTKNPIKKNKVKIIF